MMTSEQQTTIDHLRAELKANELELRRVIHYLLHGNHMPLADVRQAAAIFWNENPSYD